MSMVCPLATCELLYCQTIAKQEPDPASYRGGPRQVPAFGYKSHLSIDRRHGLVRRWTATDAAAHDGAHLGELIDRENTASDLWADTSYRSAKNQALLAEQQVVSRIHRKKPHGRPMAARTRRANARKSAVRASVEHVFAYQKGPMGLVIRTLAWR